MTTIQDLPRVRSDVAGPARTGAVLAVLLAAQLMAILDVNIVNVAAATIRTDLHTSGAGLQLIVAGYLITYAVLLITGARLGGVLGYRRAFLGGLAGFTVASLACGLAATAGELIAFRFLQGAGAALMIPQVFSLIQRHFTGDARVRALGRYAAVIAGGLVLGQVLGGILVTADIAGTGWRPVFFVNVPIGIVLLFWSARLLPADAVDAPARRLDVPGLVVLAVAVLAFVVPLLFGHQQGWPAWTFVSLSASVVLLAAFATVQRRSTAPLMPGRLFRARGFVPSLTALFVTMCAYGGYLFSVALHLQTGLHYSPLRAGLSFVPMALAFGAASLNWRRVPARWHRRMIPTGLLVAAASLMVIAIALHGSGTPGVWFYLAQIPFGLGAGAAYSPLVAAALANVAPADAADASGLVTTMVQLAQVVGLASIGSLYLSLFATHGSADAAAITVLVEAVGAALAAGCALVRRRVVAVD
jgi:EmrB/QacA subfamily drug resistance transporter